MKTIIEVIKEIRRNVKWDTPRPKNVGGQSCGVMETAVILISEEISFKIEVGWYKSQMANKNIAVQLFELALDEFVR